jgi:hypothetical protein
MKVWKTIGIVFILVIIVFFGTLVIYANFRSSSFEQEINYIQDVNKQNVLIEELDKYLNTFKEDTTEMNHIMDKYNLKSINIDERIQILNEYINYYNIRLNHLNSFYNFIVNNENELKETGVDTYGWKKQIQDTQTILKNNIAGMRNDVEMIIEYQKQTLNQQQEEQFYEMLKIFGSILI